MNLHSIVTGAISAINPPVLATLRVSTGATKNPDYSRSPTYTDVTGVPLQVQALTAKEVAHLDGLNIQGTLRAVYLNGNVEGVNRQAGKGGDLFTFAATADIPANLRSTKWLVVQVLEAWDADGWCKVAIQLQNA